MTFDDGDGPGHPRVRRWLRRHPDVPFSQRADDPVVRDLVAELGLGTVLRDLGGADHLTVLVDDGRHVLRSYKPFVSLERIAELQQVRRMVADARLATAVPISINGRTVHRCGARWAEVEPFVPVPVGGSPAALFAGLGRLHRVLARVQDLSTTDLRPSFVSVDVLRSWVRVNATDRLLDVQQVHELNALLDRIEQQWIPREALPVQVVHGDPHAGNIRHSGADPSAGHLYLDFAGIEVAPRVHDLAMAIVYQCAQRRDRVADWDGAVAGWLDAYTLTNPDGVTGSERAAIRGYAADITVYYDLCGWADDWRPWGRHLLDLDLDT